MPVCGWVLRHRRATAALIVVVCLIGMVAVVGTVSALTYQPIIWSGVNPGLSVYTADGTLAADAVQPAARPGAAGPRTLTATLKQPDMLVSLTNRGGLPVEIVGLRNPFSSRALTLDKIVMGDAHGGPPDQPFRHVELRPGDLRTFILHLKAKACVSAGDRQMWETALSQTVIFRFLGVSHQADLLHERGLSITGAPSC